MIEILDHLKDPKSIGIMVYSLLWVHYLKDPTLNYGNYVIFLIILGNARFISSGLHGP